MVYAFDSLESLSQKKQSMKKVILLGHFAFGKNEINGQTIKTKIISQALVDQLGASEVGLADTHGRWRFLMRLPLSIFKVLKNGQNIVMMPAYKGIHLITPLLVCLNVFFHRHLHYVVIGGWLPDYARRFPLLRACLKRFNGIYVETSSMQKELDAQEFKNVYVMPNCKSLTIVPKEQLQHGQPAPYKLCTFSRVIKEKGIEDAVKAVNECNTRLGKTNFTLDIYGQIEQKEWFDSLMRNQSETIRYKGIIPFNETTDVLKDYFALLFPTYYKGEAFAGTLIDALAAGIPTIASDWHSNPDLVIEGETGILFPTHDIDALIHILIEMSNHPERLLNMKEKCIIHAEKYKPENVIQVLIQKL